MLFYSLLITLALSTFGQATSKQSEDFERLSPEELKVGIEKRHPVAYYVLAGKLFEAGARDEAVFWFYAGQLRYRFHLAADPKLPPSGDPALFASLSEVMGRPINEYAFGDPPQLSATIDKVLAWDERTENGFTSKTQHAKALGEIRAGLSKLGDYVRTSADQIRADRKKNGLENRRP
jgi:hypothetical protein